jgi:hypothetical protein
MVQLAPSNNLATLYQVSTRFSPYQTETQAEPLCGTVPYSMVSIAPHPDFAEWISRTVSRSPWLPFSIASLGESNWWVTLPQSGHRYPSIIVTSHIMRISLWRRKSMVRFIPPRPKSLEVGFISPGLCGPGAIAPDKKTT